MHGCTAICMSPTQRRTMRIGNVTSQILSSIANLIEDVFALGPKGHLAWVEEIKKYKVRQISIPIVLAMPTLPSRAKPCPNRHRSAAAEIPCLYCLFLLQCQVFSPNHIATSLVSVAPTGTSPTGISRHSSRSQPSTRTKTLQQRTRSHSVGNVTRVDATRWRHLTRSFLERY